VNDLSQLVPYIPYIAGTVMVLAIGFGVRRVPGELVVLMITAFIDMLGLLMVIPLLPFYAQRLGGGGAVVGLLVSSFSIAQLISAPLWGKFSDRWGRRPALLVALAASAIAYVIFGFADSLVVLFLSRIVQGAGGGTVGVIQAYVADSTRPEDRAKSLGWLSAATNLGVAIGPVLGSYAAALGAAQVAAGRIDDSAGRAAPGLIAALLCVVNMGFAWRYLRESRDAANTPKPKQGASTAAVLRVITHSAEPAPRLIWIYAISIGAFQGTTSILALLLAAKFAVTENTIGYFFSYIGTLSVVARAVILGKAVDRFGEARLTRIGLLFIAIGLAALPLAPSLWWLALAVALLPLGTAFTFPCVTAMLSRVIPPHERGLYMGVQQTFGGVSRVIFPIVLGFSFDALGHGVPFWISASLVFVTIFLSLGMDGYVKRSGVEQPA
jgi:MFS family permease